MEWSPPMKRLRTIIEVDEEEEDGKPTTRQIDSNVLKTIAKYLKTPEMADWFCFEESLRKELKQFVKNKK